MFSSKNQIEINSVDFIKNDRPQYILKFTQPNMFSFWESYLNENDGVGPRTDVSATRDLNIILV